MKVIATFLTVSLASLLVLTHAFPTNEAARRDSLKKRMLSKLGGGGGGMDKAQKGIGIAQGVLGAIGGAGGG